jgi:uncharacterized membrane protein
VHFASPIPLWLALLVAIAIAGVAFLCYRRPLAPLSARQRGILVALRVLALAAVVVILCRPTGLMPPSGGSGVVVPILVDVSRSMRVADADGRTRIARAVDLLQREILPALSAGFTAELYSVGDTLTPASPDRLAANARRSDLSGALEAVRERYRGRRVSGIVMLSDGGDTGGQIARDAREGQGPPVFTVGIGSPEGVPDREILGITAGDPRVDQSSVDLSVSAMSSRFGRTPFQIRLLANGQLLESRSVTPAADGSPIDAVFSVSPDPLNATVYTAEIAPVPDETIVENNARSVLVRPAGRKRRLLLLEGAPGFEHSFMTRALTVDPGLELDSVVRKGRNENGEGTFLVQAGAGRAAALIGGFPSSREGLYGYDAVLIANVEGEFFTHAQLALAADFVGERGGGLLVLGGRSFAQRGLIATPLEDVLPLELKDRHGSVASAAFTADQAVAHNVVLVTAEGENHPVMRIGGSPENTRRLWSALPALSASAPVGGPKPGATVLAVTTVPGGAVYPVIAVQRYGRGRSMVFAGEASWRWRMLQPSTDRSYEYFWRQAARWLASPAPDPVAIEVPESSEPGDSIDIEVDARDRAFKPVPDATVEATLTIPGGDARPLTPRHEARGSGRFVAAFRPDQAGLYRVHAEARKGAVTLGDADRWFYVGGGDREFAEPRLNEGFLRRVARASGGEYVRAVEASRVAAWLQSVTPQHAEPERRDLWHQPWAFAFVLMLLAAEWILRRRWGLR